MPTKVKQDKAAWQWVASIQQPSDVSLKHVYIAYRCNLKPCPRGECRRNCRGNPFCLNALGEKSWFKELDESNWHDFNPDSERREEGKFVGLKNLGATCYVNTFLQLWFHNAEVRGAVYQWQDIEQPSESGDEWKPTSICGHLQLLFGLMQYSKRAYIDPSPLIECLGLDTGEQQDAQEFSKLFLSVLERALVQESFGQPVNIIQQQFAGTYCYVTRCQTCGSESKREATFYELDINIRGHSTLHTALHDFLKEEKLEGENQYMCSVCNSKQNAVRSIQLHTLPPVLNLQLLRFVFDVKKGHKKKLNSYILFGDTLDMSQFLQQPEMTTVYDLTAVLIHRGPSAYSGHYVAHIQDTTSKLWYRFNDEEITAMKGRKLQLGKEEEVIPRELPDMDGTSSPKAPRNPKGMHSSRDAYMLVYTRRKPDTGKGDEPKGETVDMVSDLPKPVKAYIDRDNSNFENWIQEIVLTQDANVFSLKEKQKLIQSIYLALHCTSSDEDFEWLPVDWLTSWLTDPEKAQPITSSHLLCPHQRLHPDNVVKMKIVSAAKADQIVTEYGADIRLKGQEAFCVECVRQRCQELQFREHLAEHSRYLTAALKQPVDGASCYWVGKNSLRSWKRYALEQIGTTESISDAAENYVEEGKANGTSSEGVAKEMEEQGDCSGDQLTADAQGLQDAFNSDLLCDQHGALDPDENCRRLVSEDVWKRLRCLFPTCPEFQKNDPACPHCLTTLMKEQETKMQHRQLYAHQRELLYDLYMGRNRPKLTQLAGRQVFAVTTTFLDSWKKFVKNREGVPAEPLNEIVNKPLLCEHERLLYPIHLSDDFSSSQMMLVWEEEWKVLTQHYTFDVAVEVLTAQEEGGELSIFTIPELCDGCVARRLQEEEEDQFVFKQATIFVRKVVMPLSNVIPDSESTMDEEDPDFMETKKLPKGDQPTAAKKAKLDEGALRKSQRHRKQRGEKEMKVSSDLTLKDFKIKVMNQFSIPTFDQNLSVDGRPVSDNEATLGQLHFYPGCVVTVKADEPSQDSVTAMETSSARKPEEGFKGTSLVSS